MGGKNKKRLKKTRKDNIIKNVKGNKPIESDSPLTFDLSKGNWLKGISISREDYTNRLKDIEMFTNYITELFHKVIPLIQKYGNDMIKQAGALGWKHCHPVKEEKLDLTIKILNEIHGSDFTKDKVAGPQLWQFGVSQNIRLIAIYDYTNNYLTPVLSDYHHLIHPDDHYNQPDYLKYTFCPIESFQSVN